MVTSDIYTKYYEINYIVSGDRQIATPNQTFYIHKGYISPININTYHIMAPFSSQSYCRYSILFNINKCKRLTKKMERNQFGSLMSIASYSLPTNKQNRGFKYF